jgi:aminopeptidase N
MAGHKVPGHDEQRLFSPSLLICHLTDLTPSVKLMAGFYRSRYKPAVEASKSVPRDSEHHYMFSTQFESCDARRAFPCFDEPNLKATFDFEIEIPEDQTALSNMPEKSTRKGSKDGWKVVSFERTPVMSTYLLAWAFGDFEYVEDFTKRKYNGKNMPVRVYTTKGLKEQGKFALENCHQVVDYFSEVCLLQQFLDYINSRRSSELTTRCPKLTF